MAAKLTKGQDGGPLLGQNTPVPEQYSPQLLHPIGRKGGRRALGLDAEPDFHGVDVWHAYELSWLQPDGKPVAAVGKLVVPASSPNMVESKSLKLYLNSLNQHRFRDEQHAIEVISADVSGVVGCPVKLELFSVGDERLAGRALAGQCLDALPVTDIPPSPEQSRLEIGNEGAGDTVYSHLLRSLCPVTGQPDWATVWISYRGRGISRPSLLSYILSFRQHQEFHEQCVERLYTDLLRRAEPEELTVLALYTRRGGLDISPLRSSRPNPEFPGRINRQ